MVAGQQLLQNKAHKELLESYDERAEAASGYMKAVRPSLCIQTGALLDPKVCTVPCHAPDLSDSSGDVQAAVSIAAGRVGMVVCSCLASCKLAMLTAPCSPSAAGALMQEPTVAAKVKSVQALVVSKETIPGAQDINHYRAEHGFPQLRVVVVELIADTQAVKGGKVSSTALRQQEAATLRVQSEAEADSNKAVA